MAVAYLYLHLANKRLCAVCIMPAEPLAAAASMTY